ncbi:MAG: hypothetical protein ACRD33_05100 [Candidatus Acidiferrales bacterium]
MKYRIAMCASAGFLVAGFWALYFARANKGNPMTPIVYNLVLLTQPIVILVHHFAVSFYWILLANAVTYALVGLIVETLRRQLNPAK